MEIRMVNGKPKEFKRTVVPPVNPQAIRDKVADLCHETVGRQDMIPMPPEHHIPAQLLANISYGRTAKKHGVHA